MEVEEPEMLEEPNLINLITTTETLQTYNLKKFAIRKYKTHQTIQNLDEIEEETEEDIEHQDSRPIETLVDPPKVPKYRKTISPPKVHSKPKNTEFSYFHTFLTKLLKWKPVYKDFIKKAESLQILPIYRDSPSRIYQKYINPSLKHLGKSEKYIKKPVNFKILKKSKTPATKRLPREVNYNNFNNPVLTEKILKEFNLALEEQKNTRNRNSLSSQASSRIWNYGQRRSILDKKSTQLQKHFIKICANGHTLSSSRLNNSRFSKFLQKRYPEHMANVFCKYVNFLSASFDDFVNELETLIKERDELHLQISFELYDFNKDSYLCYQDGYSMLEERKFNHSDEDWSHIIKMFELKKKGEGPRPRLMRDRRASVASLLFDEIAKDYENKPKKEITMEHPTKKEAIIYEEFCLIDLGLKPQILRDFFLYVCNYDIMKLLGVAKTPIEMGSEFGLNLLQTLPQASGLIKEAQKEESFRYFFDLQEAMRLFEVVEFRDLFKKFKILCDKKSLPRKLITAKSVQKSLSKLIGVKIDHISACFYDILSHRNEIQITKAVFLKRVYWLENLDKRERAELAFSVYDTRNDKKITVDEAYWFYKLLPEGSPVHSECEQLIDYFAYNIFGEKERKKYFDIDDFSIEVKESAIYEEFREILTLPLEEVKKRPVAGFTRNPVFK